MQLTENFINMEIADIKEAIAALEARILKVREWL